MGKAASSPAALGDDLYVTVESLAGQTRLVVGWAEKTPLPQVGDACLLAFDEHRDAWVVAWA